MTVQTSRILELYDAVRAAYTRSYDFFKYKGKLKKSYDGESSKYYSTLLKLQARFRTENEVGAHFAFNFFARSPWITELTEESALRITAEYEKRTQAIDRFFKADLLLIAEKYPGCLGFKKLITETEFNAPLLDMLLGGKIHLTTFAFIDSVTNASQKWKSRAWKAHSKRINLTSRFIFIDSDTKLMCKDIIFDVFEIKR